MPGISKSLNKTYNNTEDEGYAIVKVNVTEKSDRECLHAAYRCPHIGLHTHTHIDCNTNRQISHSTTIHTDNKALA